MDVFDKIKNDWIQVVDDQNNITIENYGFNTGIIEGTTGNHCTKCVAVNGCWFKNETDKKPAPLTLSRIEILNNIFKGIMPGLYHPYCHCMEEPILTPTPDMIKLVIPNGKDDWLFLDKMNWLISMGYANETKENIIALLNNLSKQAYAKGNYKLREHNKHGFKITLYLDFPGKNEKLGKIYKLEAGWTIFPNGKIKCNTYIGGTTI